MGPTKLYLLGLWLSVLTFFHGEEDYRVLYLSNRLVEARLAAKVSAKPLYRAGQVFNLALDPRLQKLRRENPEKFNALKAHSAPNGGPQAPFFTKPTTHGQSELLYVTTLRDQSRNKLRSARGVMQIKQTIVENCQAAFDECKRLATEFPGDTGRAYESTVAGRRLYDSTQEALKAAQLVGDAEQELAARQLVVDEMDIAINGAASRTDSYVDIDLNAKLKDLITEFERHFPSVAHAPGCLYERHAVTTAVFEGQALT